MKNTFVLFMLTLLFSVSAQAAVIEVNTTTDENDGCTNGSGCSIRDAIAQANRTLEIDTVTIPAGTFNITLGEINVTRDIIIQGVSEQETIIQGSNERFLQIYTSTTTSSAFTLKNMTVINFNDSDGACLYANISPPSFLGKFENVTFDSNTGTNYSGCIQINGDSVSSTRVEFSYVKFINNVASNNGPAISAHDATVDARFVVFKNNQTSDHNGYGGALYLENSSFQGDSLIFENNHADMVNSQGGAIYATASLLDIRNSLFTGNSTTEEGGAIFFSNLTTELKWFRLTDSSFINNSARDGGAVKARSSLVNAKVDIVGSTFVKNKAIGSSTGPSPEGSAVYLSRMDANISYSTFTNNTVIKNSLSPVGALHVQQIDTATAAINIKASIITGNTTKLYNDDTAFIADNCFYAINIAAPPKVYSYGYNLWASDCSTRAIPSTANPDDVGVDPLFTRTYLKKGDYDFTPGLSPASPAINRAEASPCSALPHIVDGSAILLTTDSLGRPRPVGSHCDIGALEKNECLIDNPACSGEKEICDGTDNNGNGEIDEGFDADSDGVANCVDTEECDTLDNDGDGQVDEDITCTGPIAEVCDGFDNNSDGTVDEGFDADGDGTADCLESLEETCNGIDDNGNGLVDEDFTDTDGDFIADCVDTEECDTLDNDGDSLVDEDGICSSTPDETPGEEVPGTDTTETPEETPDDSTDNTTDEPDSADDNNGIGTDTGNPEGNKSSGGGCSLSAQSTNSSNLAGSLMLILLVGLVRIGKMKYLLNNHFYGHGTISFL